MAQTTVVDIVFFLADLSYSVTAVAKKSTQDESSRNSAYDLVPTIA